MLQPSMQQMGQQQMQQMGQQQMQQMGQQQMQQYLQPSQSQGQGVPMSGYPPSSTQTPTPAPTPTPNYPRVAPQQYVAHPQQFPLNQIPFEKSAATAVMGMPNSIFKKVNPQTGNTEFYQTQVVMVDIQRNEYGFGINLGDNDGVVRIQGCRSNPDGTPSPVQMNPNIRPGDVIYKVQDKVLTGSNPLGLVGEGREEG